MRWGWTLLVVGLTGSVLAQQIQVPDTISAQDYIQALRQQREEAQDKLAQAYMVISKLQRELDKLKADNAPHPAH